MSITTKRCQYVKCRKKTFLCGLEQPVNALCVIVVGFCSFFITWIHNNKIYTSCEHMTVRVLSLLLWFTLTSCALNVLTKCDIATWGRPSQASPHHALITTPLCQFWSCWFYQLPYYNVFVADSVVIFTFDLWPWTFAACRLWRDETPYQMWTLSSNPRRSYCDFSVSLYGLKHYVTCSARIWYNFHEVWPSTTYPCLNYSVFTRATGNSRFENAKFPPPKKKFPKIPVR